MATKTEVVKTEGTNGKGIATLTAIATILGIAAEIIDIYVKRLQNQQCSTR